MVVVQAAVAATGPFGLAPEWVTAISTFFIFVFTLVSAYALVRTLSHNSDLVDATARQAEIQWQAAIPQLRAGELARQRPAGGAATAVSMPVEYRAGSLPARDIHVWVAFQGTLYHGHQDTLFAADERIACRVNALSGQADANSGFADMTFPTGDGEWWVGLSWRDTMHQLYRISTEMVNGSYHVLSRETRGVRTISEMSVEVRWNPDNAASRRCERCSFWSPVAAELARSDRAGSIVVCLKHALMVSEGTQREHRKMMQFVMELLP